ELRLRQMIIEQALHRLDVVPLHADRKVSGHNRVLTPIAGLVCDPPIAQPPTCAIPWPASGPNSVLNHGLALSRDCQRGNGFHVVASLRDARRAPRLGETRPREIHSGATVTNSCETASI